MPHAIKGKPDWGGETKDWRIAQSSRTSLASLTQIQGIYREIQETLAREFRPLPRLSPENGPLSAAGVEFGTGNLNWLNNEFGKGNSHFLIINSEIYPGLNSLQRPLTITIIISN